MAKGRKVPDRESMPLKVIIPWPAPEDGNWRASTETMVRAAWKYFAAIAERGQRHGITGLVDVQLEPSETPGMLFGSAEWVPADGDARPDTLAAAATSTALGVVVFYQRQPVYAGTFESEYFWPHTLYAMRLKDQGLHDHVAVIAALDIA